MTYQVPCNAPISDSYQGHRNRGSAEPGTDYGCAYGTSVVAAGNGVVTVADSSNGGAAGRRVTVDLDDGRRVSYIHLSKINVNVGQRVKQVQVVALSGASGFGQDWYYGPHVHVSLWERPGMSYANTIDFEKYVGTASSAYNGEDDEMTISYINIQGAAGKRRGGCYAVMRDNNGKLFARFVSPSTLAGVPTIQNGRALNEIQASIPGLA